MPCPYVGKGFGLGTGVFFGAERGMNDGYPTGDDDLDRG